MSAACRMKRDVAGCDASLCFGDELERDSVHAVAETCGLGAVVEDVADVRVAARAEDFRTNLWKTPVLLLAHVALRDRRPEARPARLRVVLRLRAEEREVAADAQVRAARVLLVEGARV